MNCTFLSFFLGFYFYFLGGFGETTWSLSWSTAAFLPLLNYWGGKVLTEPNRGARGQDGNHDGLEEGGEEGDHREGGRVHPVL